MKFIKNIPFTMWIVLAFTALAFAAAGVGISTWTTFTTLADGDLFATTDVSDTSGSDDGTSKTISYVNVKANLKTYFDTVYAAILGADVVGPSSATDNAISRFDTTTGKLIQDSGVTIDDNDIITSKGTSVLATSSGGQYTYYLEATGFGTGFSGRAVYGDLTHSTLYADPLVVGVKNQFMIYAAPVSRTMGDTESQNVASSTFVTYSKEAAWTVIDSDTVIAVADGLQAFVVPASMVGLNLVDVTASVHDLNSAASGTTTVVIRRVRGNTPADMTSTGVTIDYDEYTASDETVDTANDDLALGDKIYVDVNAITTAAQKGLSVTVVFELP